MQDNAERANELSVSQEALRRIGELFELDRSYRSLSVDERLEKRRNELRTKADEYFAWVESRIGTVPPKSETGKGLSYSMNQKKYLLACLSTADVPLDNSEAERKIRNFVISRKNFVLIDTINGARASTILFSVAETAKANNLRPYEYFKYLLEVFLPMKVCLHGQKNFRLRSANNKPCCPRSDRAAYFFVKDGRCTVYESSIRNET